MSKDKTTSYYNSPFDSSVGDPLLYIGIYCNTDVTEEDYKWSFIVGPAKEEAGSEEQKFWMYRQLSHTGDGRVCGFKAHQLEIQDEEYLLGRLMIAEVKDLTGLDKILCSSPPAHVRENWKFRSLFWVKAMLERLVGEGCLKGKPKAFEVIEREGREFAQRRIQINETIGAMYVLKGQWAPILDFLDRGNSQGAGKGKEVEAVGKGKETKAILQGMEGHSATPVDATSSTNKTKKNLVPEYDSDSDAEDSSKEVVEVHKHSSSSSMGPPSKPASSMGPPKLPASATRGKKRDGADKGAGTEAPGQERKFWSIDDLPVERYTKDGCRIW